MTETKRRVALGLDLGQASDYTAMAVVEELRQAGEDASYNVRGVKRVLLGTPYTVIAQQVGELLRRPEMQGASLVVDAGGCGLPVVDLFRSMGLRPVPVMVHGGSEETRDGGTWHVPKRDLVATLLVLLQTERLKIAAGTEHMEQIRHELLSYRVTYSPTGHDSYGAWRESDHDDLVFALGLACWWLRRPVFVPMIWAGKARPAW